MIDGATRFPVGSDNIGGMSVRLFKLFAVAVVAYSCTFSAYAIEESLETVSSRGGDQKFLLIKPDGKPTASVILFTGGMGQLSLSSFAGSPSVGEKKKNFLVRTRDLFAEHGFLVATVDTHEGMPKMSPIWRMGKEHAEDISAVVTYLKQQADVPVWVVGTSMGSFSAANMGIRLNGTIHGVVLTSTPNDMRPEWKMIYEHHPRGVISMELDRVTGPAFIAAHEHDVCDGTNPKYTSDLANAFSSSPNVEKIVFSGPDVRIGGACGGMGPHGFLNMESEVVDAIAKFIKSN